MTPGILAEVTAAKNNLDDAVKNNTFAMFFFSGATQQTLKAKHADDLQDMYSYY